MEPSSSPANSQSGTYSGRFFRKILNEQVVVGSVTACLCGIFVFIVAVFLVLPVPTDAKLFPNGRLSQPLALLLSCALSYLVVWTFKTSEGEPAGEAEVSGASLKMKGTNPSMILWFFGVLSILGALSIYK
jgi:hypothetical protein